MTNRKITFHVIKFYKKKSDNIIYKNFDFEAFVTWFNTINNEEKIFNLSQNKFTSLDFIEKIDGRNYQGYQSVYFGMMSTGNIGSRRHLKNSIDNSKRDNPKEIHEGEEQENYFLLAFKNKGEIDLILQNTGRGIKSNHLKNYIDKFLNNYISQNQSEKEFRLTEGAIVSTPDLLINKLDRITKTKIFIDKSILGEESLNLADRTLSVREDLIIDVRAHRGSDIRDFLQDLRQKLVYNTKVDKLWIEGKDSHGNISSFYLNKIQKSTYVTIDIDPETASLVKDTMRIELLKLI